VTEKRIEEWTVEILSLTERRIVAATVHPGPHGATITFDLLRPMPDVQTLSVLDEYDTVRWSIHFPQHAQLRAPQRHAITWVSTDLAHGQLEVANA
jgi:hypothetical protein